MVNALRERGIGAHTLALQVAIGQQTVIPLDIVSLFGPARDRSPQMRSLMHRNIGKGSETGEESRRRGQ